MRTWSENSRRPRTATARRIVAGLAVTAAVGVGGVAMAGPGEAAATRTVTIPGHFVMNDPNSYANNYYDRIDALQRCRHTGSTKSVTLLKRTSKPAGDLHGSPLFFTSSTWRCNS